MSMSYKPQQDIVVVLRHRDDVILSFQELDKPKDDCAKSPSKLSNGYVLPQGKLTPNALFVGGIDLKVRFTVEIFFLNTFFRYAWTKTDVQFICVCVMSSGG